MYNNIEINNAVDNKKKTINLNEMSIVELISFVKKSNEEELSILIKDKNLILNMPINNFNTFFLNLPFNNKKELFKDKDYIQKLLQIPKNRFGKTFFELLKETEKIEFLKNKKELDEIDSNLFINLINQLSVNEINKFKDELNKTLTNEDYQLFVKQLNTKFNIDDNLKTNIINKLKTQKRTIFKYLKIENNNQLFLYNKFNLILKVNKYDDNSEAICFDDNSVIKKEELEQMNEKHMNLIIEKMLQNVTSEKPDYTKIFITSLKMYKVFGFDNTIKILNNKFTYMNINSLKKFAFFDFIDKRRQFRLENQEKFYSYEMLQKTKKALENNDLYFFCNICQNIDDEYLIAFVSELKYTIKSNPNKNIDEIITPIIRKEIKEREENLRKEYIEKYCNKHATKKNLQRTPINYEELYKIFKNITYNPKLDEKGRVIVSQELKKFLLGNEKYDNDCLLRLILNKKDFGLNQNLSTLINSFDNIKKIVSKNKKDFSLYSVLDVIDICKSTLYKLAYNEQDMTLETVSKIETATQYCEEPSSNIFLRAKKLHLERKQKVYSSIPSVEGKTKNNIKYKVLNFDYEALITCGIDTGSCLRVGGKGEDFLRYCMTNPHSVIIGLYDEENKFYICPFIRNGNGIYGNGLDPEPETEEKKKALLEALQKCTNEIMKKSNNNEKIDFATITDLHQQDFLKNQNLKSLKLDTYIALDEVFYADYNKDEMTSYIITSNTDNPQMNLYKPKEKYYQNRVPNYVYNTNTERDKERIEILINSIKYSSIDFNTRLTKGEKGREKRNFKKLKIDKFEYIIGNKDWFIAIDNSYNIISCILPYDKRASKEYMEAFKSLNDRYNINMEGKTLS